MADKYFDDMWLSIENELTHFDGAIQNRDWMDTSNSGASGNSSGIGDSSKDPNVINLSPATYEGLMDALHAPAPANSELRSKSRAERIDAVKRLYNQMPTIINARSVAQLHRTANKLYRLGFVKAANDLLSKEEDMVGESTYVEETPDCVKSMEIANHNGIQKVTVAIQDKTDGHTMEKTFDNLLPAVKYFMSK